MKYEYYVEPSADIKKLQILAEGADLVSNKTSLQINTSLGMIQDANLLVYEQNSKQNLSSSCFTVKNNTFSFNGIPDERQETVVIDPLVYSTYIGGTGNDSAQGITVDTVGNAYITGKTRSSDFPTTSGAYQTTKNSGEDAFVVKFSFTSPAHSVSASVSGGHGSVSPATQFVDDGNDAIIYLTPDTGCHVVSILDNGVSMPITNPYRILSVTEDHTIVIAFELNMYTVTASVNGGNGSVIPPFQTVQYGGNATVKMVADQGYTITKLVVDGQDSIITYITPELRIIFNSIDKNHTVVVTFSPIPNPILDLSIELNKHEFCYGDDVLYKITVHNTSPGPATITKLQITLPREIQYVSADRYRGQVQSGGVILFDLGTIPGNSHVTFQINATVALRTSVMTSAATLFYVSCKEDVFDETVVYTTFKSCDGSNPIPYIKAVLLNTQYDPETGERYIEQNKELLMDVTIDGFTVPYKIEISWGDGEKESLDKQKDKTLNFKHKYTANGTMEIRIRVIDTYGKSKEVSAKIKVK